MAIRRPSPNLPAFTSSPYDGLTISEQEFLSLPEEKPYLEYISGVVRQKPMVNADHRKLVGRLDGWFFMYSREHGGDFGPEGRVAAFGSGDYLLPDVAFFVAGAPSGDDSVPTLAVEVRSPRQSLARLRDKCRAYVRDGSAAASLVDPSARTVEVFAGRGSTHLRPGDVLTCSAMPGFELPVAELFAVLEK